LYEVPDKRSPFVAERLRPARLGQACKRSKRLIQKSRGAAVMINIAVKRQL
jgi:hypothetical protein